MRCMSPTRMSPTRMSPTHVSPTAGTPTQKPQGTPGTPTFSPQVFSHHCPFLMGPIECLMDVVTPDTDIQVGGTGTGVALPVLGTLSPSCCPVSCVSLCVTAWRYRH